MAKPDSIAQELWDTLNEDEKRFVGYEEAIEKMVEAANDAGNCYGGWASTPMIIEAAEAIGLREMMEAVEAAQSRVAEVYSTGRQTMIGAMSAKDFAEWDGTKEIAIVADKDGA